MNLNNNLNDNCNSKISEFANELNTFLDNTLEGDLFTIDKIENDVAICENRRTRKLINLNLSVLPANIKESDIIKYISGKFVLDLEEKESAQKRINDKFNSLLKK